MNKNLYCFFIDFRQAFNSVWRHGMTEALNYFGFEPDLISTIKRLYEGTNAKVKKITMITDKFETTKGVIQGCPLSPHLFNIYLEWVIKMALDDVEGGVEIGGIRITNLRYADDIVIIAETIEDLISMIERIEVQCNRYKMKINTEKTKSMKIGRHTEVIDLRIGDNTIEQVDKFKYLGVNFTSQGGTEKIVQERLSLGYKSFGRLIKIWKDRNISLKLKIKLLKSIVIPTALYGAETWIIRKKEEQKILAFKNRYLRRICNISWMDRIPNEIIKERTGMQHTMVDRIHNIQRRWFGHVQRMNNDRWPKMTLQGSTRGTRPHGHPRTTWIKQFRATNENRTIHDLGNMAMDRRHWRDWRHRMWDPTRNPLDGT